MPLPQPTPYSWVIDWGDDEIGLETDQGVYGPHGALRPPDSGGTPFRLFDDDGNLYYEGRVFGDYEGFEPLDDFGTPNAGCTRIEYKNPLTDEWEPL
jgi:hypothetical protein